MSEPVVVVAETTQKERSKEVEIKVRVGGKTQTIRVPVDENFKACRKDVAAMRAETELEKRKTRKDSDVVLEQSMAPSVDAMTLALMDCEDLVKRMRERGDDGVEPELVRLSVLTAGAYASWREALAGATVDDDKVPLYVERMKRPINEETGEIGEWSKSETLNLRANQLHQRLTAKTLLLISNMGMHKNSTRMLWLERPYKSEDGLVFISFYIIYAIEGDYRAEMHAKHTADCLAAGAAAPPPFVPEPAGTPREVVLLMADVKIGRNIDTREQPDTPAGKKENEKRAQLMQNRFDLTSEIYFRRRFEKRNNRLCALIPALIGAGIASFAQMLAPLYDPAGVKVPREATIIELTVSEGVLDYDRSAILTHSNVRQLMAQYLGLVKSAEADYKAIEDKHSGEARDAFLALRKHAEQYDGLLEIDRLASLTSTRNEIVFSIVDLGTGVDSGTNISARLVRIIDPLKLIKQTEFMLEKAKRQAESAQPTSEPAKPATPPAESAQPTTEPAQPAAPLTPIQAPAPPGAPPAPIEESAALV